MSHLAVLLMFLCRSSARRVVSQFMLQVLDVRDGVDSDRFVQVHFDPVCEQKVPLVGAAVPGDASAPGGADPAATQGLHECRAAPTGCH